MVTKEEFDYDERLVHDMSNTFKAGNCAFSPSKLYMLLFQRLSTRLYYVAAGYTVMLAA